MSMSKKTRQRWREFFQALRDKGMVGISLTILLGVDLVLNAVSMAVLSPGPVEKIGFVAVGIIIVALGVPAYLRNFKGLWLTFAILSAFLNTSFILEGTRIQSSAITVENDSEIKRLDDLATKRETELSDWQAQYAKAVAGANMERIKDQLDQTRSDLEKIQSDRKSRYTVIENGDARQVISSEEVFLAIPSAIGITGFPSSVIKLAFFGSLFFAMQRAIVIFAKGGHKETGRKEKKPNTATEEPKEYHKGQELIEEPEVEPIPQQVENEETQTESKKPDSQNYGIGKELG